MTTLYGASLWQAFKKASENARKRVWLASPYIGGWSSIGFLLGDVWWRDSVLQLRVLTDKEEYSDPYTLAMLFKRSEAIGHIRGLHAKIYIFDDSAILTSANLTRSGFDQRIEIGMLLDSHEAIELIRRFDLLWEESTKMTQTEVEQSGTQFKDSKSDDSTPSLPSRWGLGAAPISSKFALDDQVSVSEYRKFLNNHDKLSALYVAVQRLWDDMPIKLEVDAFLNFLYNDHPARPSNAHYGHEKGVPRNLSEDEQENEIRRLAQEFRAYESLNEENKEWRKANYELIKETLAKGNIRSLDRTEANEVAACLHTLNAHGQRNLRRFKDDRNSIEAIRKTWIELLDPRVGVEKRIEASLGQVYGFGRNSAQELLGWFFPDDLPIRNDNAEAGLFYLGFSYD